MKKKHSKDVHVFNVLCLQVICITRLRPRSKDTLTELAQRSIASALVVVPLSSGLVKLKAVLSSHPVIRLTFLPVSVEERKRGQHELYRTLTIRTKPMIPLSMSGIRHRLYRHKVQVHVYTMYLLAERGRQLSSIMKMILTCS